MYIANYAFLPLKKVNSII